MKFSEADTIAVAFAALGALFGVWELDLRCCEAVRAGTVSTVAGKPIFNLSVALGTSSCAWCQF